MSDEETKESGELVVALTEEERLYQEAVSDLNDARSDLREAKSALKKWKEDHEEEGFSLSDPDLLQLKKDVNDADQLLQNANQRLNDAERRWKDACAAAEHVGTVSSLDEQIKNAVKQAFDELEKNKRKCVALSQVSGTKRKDMLAHIHASIAILDIKEPVVKTKDAIPVFNWSQLDEDQQVAQYMGYLDQHLNQELRSHDLVLFDVSTRKHLLNVKDERLPFDLSGGTDVLIMRNMGSFEVQQLKHFPGLRLVIELKKSLETQKEFDDGEAQTLAELIAVDILAHESAVVLLTDLNHVWNFMWLGQNKTIISLFLREPYNAFSFIRQLISKSEKEWDLHIPFAKKRADRTQKRIKFNEMIPPVSGTNIGEMLERYESISSMLGPDLDMAREIGLQVVSEMPAYQSMFT